MIRAEPVKYRRARRHLIRSALVWTPSFIAFAGMSAYFLIKALDGDSGTWVAFAVTGLMGLLVSFASIASLRDLFAQPIETEARLQRKWTRFDMLVLPVHYILVGKRVFRISKLTYLEMPEEGVVVRCLHYPYTNTLVDWRSMEELPPLPSDHPSTAAPPDDEQPVEWPKQHKEETSSSSKVTPPTFGDRR